MKATKSKSAIQSDATEFLRATKRLLTVFADSPPNTDESYAYSSSLRTLGRCVRGLEGAKTDQELAAEMKVAINLLHDLQIISFYAAEDQILLDEPDPEGHMARAQDLMDLIEELEAICTRQKE
jgi:hypothetical protein